MAKLSFTTKQVQRKLIELGYDVGKAKDDGKLGPKTEAAIVEFKKDHGLAARPYLGPITLGLLFNVRPEDILASDDAPNAGTTDQLPWMVEISKYMGMHESKNKKELMAWLKSDGAALGDIEKFPWCADGVQTPIKLTLPNEPFPGPLAVNPYWAQNYQYLGEPTKLAYGAVVAFKRPQGGHVGFAVGYDPVRKRIRVRGTNQSNSVNDTWVEESRLVKNSKGVVVGIRKPSTWKKALPPIPIMNSKGQFVSKNEA